jgi:dsDNA-binding SOS-regulon protein
MVRGIWILLGVACIACAPAKPNLTLHQAARQGDAEQLQAHFYHGSDLEQAGPEGRSALTAASRAGQREAVRLLLERGAAVGAGPLAAAAAEGHRTVVEILLGAGAKPQPGLLPAVRGGHRSVVGLLVERGADPNAAGADGTLPLAAAAGDAEMRTLLIELGAEQTPQMLADRLLHHLDAIFALLAEYEDCQRAADAVRQYTDQHAEQLRELLHKSKRLDETMSQAEKKAFMAEMRDDIQALLKKSTPTLMDFAKRCPEHMKQVGEAMQFLSGQ